MRKKLERQAGIPVWVLETMLKSWFNWQLKKPVNLKQEIFCKMNEMKSGLLMGLKGSGSTELSALSLRLWQRF